MNREIDDVDIRLIEVAKNATQSGDVAIGGDLQARRGLVGDRHSQRGGGHELRVGVGEADIDAAAGNLLLELLRAALGDHPSAVEDRHPVGEPVGLVEVLRGQEHGGAVVDQTPHDLPHRATAARIEAGRRLIEEDDLRRADQGHRQIETATHPTRVRHDDPVGGIGQLEPLEQLVGAFARGDAGEVVQVGHQRQVLSAGQQLIDRRELTGHADRGADRVGLAPDVVSGDTDRAVIRIEQRGEDPHHRRLARPVGPQQGEHAAPLDGKLEPVEDDVVAEGLADIDGGDGR